MSSLGELVGRTFMLGGDGGFTLHGCPQSEEGDGIVPGEGETVVVGVDRGARLSGERE